MPKYTHHLPVELWNRIFQHLIPHGILTVKDCRMSRAGPPPLTLTCSNEEHPDIKAAVHALAETTDLLFPSSQSHYWTALALHAAWRMQWEESDRHGSRFHLSMLSSYCGTDPKNIVAVVDATTHCQGTKRVDVKAVTKDTLTMIVWALRTLDMQSFTIRVDLECRHAPMRLACLRTDPVGALLQSSLDESAQNWRDYWGYSNVKDFCVLVDTYERDNKGRRHLVLQENITSIWTHELEKELRDELGQEGKIMRTTFDTLMNCENRVGGRTRRDDEDTTRWVCGCDA